MGEIKRGDVYWINLDPTNGSEIKKTRPCVVVSNDIGNRFSPLITVVPITTQRLGKTYPHEVQLDTFGKLKTSKIKANQIRTVDRKPIGRKILALPRPLMEMVDFALATHLDLVE